MGPCTDEGRRLVEDRRETTIDSAIFEYDLERLLSVASQSRINNSLPRGAGKALEQQFGWRPTCMSFDQIGRTAQRQTTRRKIKSTKGVMTKGVARAASMEKSETRSFVTLSAKSVEGSSASNTYSSQENPSPNGNEDKTKESFPLFSLPFLAVLADRVARSAASSRIMRGLLPCIHAPRCLLN